eukprot:gene44894-55871_t
MRAQKNPHREHPVRVCTSTCQVCGASVVAGEDLAQVAAVGLVAGDGVVQRNGGNLGQIVARNEAGAAFMADGYARETGKLGVCISTSGPGATNMLTAVATSHANGVPLLVITAQPNLPSFGKVTLQESSCTGIDVLAMFRHCTRYNTMVSHPAQLEWKLVTALQHATRTAPGPVHLSVPSDVFRAASPQRAPSYDLATLQGCRIKRAVIALAEQQRDL